MTLVYLVVGLFFMLPATFIFYAIDAKLTALGMFILGALLVMCGITYVS